jgi:hypothetical protein
MCEERLPHAKLELVHEIDDKHIGWIKGGAKLLNEGILMCENQYLSRLRLPLERYNTDFRRYS